jgi:hypothetical protein
LIHFDIQLGQAREIVKGKPVVLMPIDVLKVNLDWEFAFNDPDGANKINVCNGQWNLPPVVLPMSYAAKIITAQLDAAFRDVVESTESQKSQ